MLSRYLTVLVFLVSLTISSQETKYQVLNTSINSPYAELGTRFLSDETVVYASSKKIEEDEAFNKKRRRRQRQLFIALYKGLIAENGDLIDQGRFLHETQQNIHLADFVIAPDDKTIYFTWNNYHPYMIDTIENYWSNLRIMKGTINAENEIDIPNAHPLPFVNFKNNYNQLALSADGKTLYFTSDLPKGAGGMDIYKVDILGNDKYSEPKNLGNKVNSSQDELFPFIDAGNNLYFASYGHRGRGGLDIFKSSLVNGEFTTLDHLEEPINSKADDFGLIINPGTQKGYFTSNRNGGQGDVDIYAFEPDIPECINNVMATFVDFETKQHLKNVQVSVLNEDGAILNSLFFTEFRTGIIPLSCDSNLTIRIEKETYETLEFPIQTGSTYDEEISKEFNLVAIPCTQFITGDILHKLELNPILDAKVSLYTGDTLFVEQQLTGTNSFSLEAPCDTDYTLVVSKYAFEEVKSITPTGSKFRDTISKNILLAPKECSQIVEVAVFDVETSSKVSRFKTRLLENGNLIDVKNIINGNEFSFELNCDSNYTIELEKEGFEFAKFSVSTNDTYDVVHQKDLRLQAIPCTQFIAIEGTSPRDQRALEAAQINIIRDGIQIGTTRNFSKIQLPCHADIALEISSPGFVTKTVQFKTTGIFEYVHQMRATLDPYICEQEFTLSVADEKTKSGLTTFNLEIHDGSSIRTKYIRNGSTAIETLNCDTDYRFKIEQDGYEPTEFTLSTSSLKGEKLNKTVFLKPLVCEQTITGRVLDKETGKAISNALVTISSGNTFSENLSVDANGNFNFTANCNETYSIKTSLLNYDSNEFKVTTTNVRGGSIQKDILLQRDLEFTIVAGKRFINTKNIVFDLNKIDINEATAIELNKVVSLLKKYPSMKLFVKSHTDSRAPDALNLNLTEGRANSIKEYLASKGIDISRIRAKGLGETELLNKCSNGVDCSDAEHKKNRRTEFIVTN